MEYTSHMSNKNCTLKTYMHNRKKNAQVPNNAKHQRRYLKHTKKIVLQHRPYFNFGIADMYNKI